MLLPHWAAARYPHTVLRYLHQQVYGVSLHAGFAHPAHGYPTTRWAIWPQPCGLFPDQERSGVFTHVPQQCEVGLTHDLPSISYTWGHNAAASGTSILIFLNADIFTFAPRVVFFSPFGMASHHRTTQQQKGRATTGYASNTHCCGCYNCLARAP